MPLLPTSPAGSAIFCRGTFLEKATFHLRWNLGSLQTWQGGRWLGYGEGFYMEPPSQAEETDSPVKGVSNQDTPGLRTANHIQTGTASAV